MRPPAILIVFALSTALVSCSDVAPTAPDVDATITTESEIVGFGKSDNAAVVTIAEDLFQLMIMADSKRDLLAIFYGDEVAAEAILPGYSFNCDLPEASVPSELKTVVHPSTGSGMWRYKGSTAVAIYHFPIPLVFPPAATYNCADYELVAYGTVDQYLETGNDFWLVGDRTLTFGLTAKGELYDALHEGQMVDLNGNARAMYNKSDLKEGIFNSLARNTNIRLSPDPRN